MRPAVHPHLDGGRVVTFDHRTGNEWWVEVVLAGQDAGQVSGVEAQDEGGAWTPLALKSWGAWAASFRIEPGNDVRFRASWPGGAQTVSCWFTHPGGVESCPTTSSSTTTTTTSTSASSSASSTTTTSSSSPSGGPSPALAFDHRGGNEWWVEVAVSGATPTRVQAQDDGGPWTDLQAKSWGTWAASFRIEPGHAVRFRAEAGGAWSESCWFTHPGGLTPTGGQTCGATTPPAGFATFSGVKGNPYWVEVRVTSSKPLAGVDARLDDGAWRPLSLRDWGAWAGSFPVPDGSYVDFRATATDGATALSGDHVWPTARLVKPWPQPGSFVTYAIRNSGGAPDGSYWQTTDATLRLAFDGAAWTGRCAGQTRETDYTGAETTTSFDEAVSGAPATGPRDTAVGASFDPVLFEGTTYGRCYQAEDTVVVTEGGRFQTSLRESPGGRQVVLPSWMAHEPEGNSGFEADTVVLDARLGLLLDWSHSGRGGGFDGHLIDTDAPIR